MEMVGKVFSDKTDMGANSSQLRMGRKYENNNGSNVHPYNISLFFHYSIAALTNDVKKVMATLTVLWKTFYIVGYLILGSSFLIAFQAHFLDINFDLAPPAFKTVMYTLSCFVLFVYSVRGFVSVLTAYEKYRKDRMENNEAYMNYSDRKGAHDEAKKAAIKKPR